MELVEGETLRQRAAGRQMKLGVLLDLALQIAEAIAEAHRRGVVHRDIKSGNILVTPQGRIKMLDFGLAKRVAVTTSCGSARCPGKGSPILRVFAWQWRMMLLRDLCDESYPSGSTRAESVITRIGSCIPQ